MAKRYAGSAGGPFGAGCGQFRAGGVAAVEAAKAAGSPVLDSYWPTVGIARAARLKSPCGPCKAANVAWIPAAKGGIDEGIMAGALIVSHVV